MPIQKRLIEPVNVSRNEVAKSISNELDCVSNNTMSQIILQLSSLSKLSEDIFAELHIESCHVFYKTCHIFKRVELLKQKIIQLNPIAEEVSLHDINQRLPFKSETKKDQEIVTISTRPKAINDVYQCIDPAPPLHILNNYRDDGKDSLKFYTDPSYFFELWKCEMVKDAENQMKKQRHKVKRRSTKDSIQFTTQKTNKNEVNKSFKLSKMPDVKNISVPNYTDQLVPGDIIMPSPLMRDVYLNHSDHNTHLSDADRVFLLNLARQESDSHFILQQEKQFQLQQQMLLLQQQAGYSYHMDNNDPQLHNASSDHEFPEVSLFFNPHSTDIKVGGHGSDGYVPRSHIHSSTPSCELEDSNSRHLNDNLPPPPIPPLPAEDSVFTPPPPPPPPDHNQDNNINKVDNTSSSSHLPLFNSPLQNVDVFNDSSYLPSPPKNIPAYSLTQPGDQSNSRRSKEDQAFQFSPGVEDLLSRIEGSCFSTNSKSDNKTMNSEYKQYQQPQQPQRHQIHHDTSVVGTPGNKKSPTTTNQPHHSQTPTIHLSRNSSRRKSLERSLTTTTTPAMKSSATNDQPLNTCANNNSNTPNDANVSNTSNLQYQHSIIRDSRSELLSAIKKGIQLRKVEEHRQKTQQNVKRRLDVQSIMEAAFELRRKVMEENDGEDENDDDNGGWSDEE